MQSVLDKLQASGPQDVLFVPIYGQDDSTDALCSLLRIEGVTILLDCGWTEKCDLALLEPLAAVAPSVDIVCPSHLLRWLVVESRALCRLPQPLVTLELKPDRLICLRMETRAHVLCLPERCHSLATVSYTTCP